MAQVCEVVLVEGTEPAKGVPVGSNPLTKKLNELNLGQYATPLMDDQGYDDMKSLQGLSVEELTQIAEAEGLEVEACAVEALVHEG